MNNTEKMLDSLIEQGHLVGFSPEDATKKISHQEKMVLLRFWYNWIDSNDSYSETKFFTKWQPIRERLEGWQKYEEY